MSEFVFIPQPEGGSIEEEFGTHITDVDVLFAVDPSISIKYYRIGHSVTLTLDTIPANSNKDTTGNPVTVTPLPESLRPEGAIIFWTRVRDNTSEKTGYVTVGTDGLLTWDLVAASWVNGANSNIGTFGISYTVGI